MESKNLVLLLFCGINAITGTYMNVGSKFMNRQTASPCYGCPPRFFFAPLFQAMLLFTGQMVVFMAWGADQCVVQATLRVTRNYPLGHFEVRNESSFLKPTTSLGTWVLPSLLNFISKVGGRARKHSSVSTTRSFSHSHQQCKSYVRSPC